MNVKKTLNTKKPMNAKKPMNTKKAKKGARNDTNRGVPSTAARQSTDKCELMAKVILVEIAS
jgi:hypothetical protein